MLLVNNHTLCAHGVLLGSGTESLVATGLACSTTGAGLCLHAGLLANDVEHRVLQRLFVLAQPVLLPGVVKDTVVEVVALHATLKVVEALTVVRLLLELERAAVLHVLAELAGVTAAELLKTRLNLLLLDVIVLLVLGATGQTLPRQLTLDEVQQDVADRLQIVTPGLLNTLVGSN